VKLAVMASQVSREQRAMASTSGGSYMNRAGTTQASRDYGRPLRGIVDHLIRTRGFHWLISLTVID
jgi:hypothetical protein